MTVLDKILYGQKVTNENIVTLNDKVDALLKILVEETEPTASDSEESMEA